MTDTIDVAVAVLIRPDGRVLLAQRPAGKVYGGWWEFPGGKIESGEAAAHALAREVHEELGVDAEHAYPWLTRGFEYPHATVRLHFFRVLAWRGEPHGREGQAFAWEDLGALSVGPVLPANGPVLKSLRLPTEYAISNAAEVGEERFLAAVQARFAAGLRLVQLREKALPRDRLAALARRVVASARPFGAIVLVNSDAALARETGAHGVHLTTNQLATAPERPDMGWVGASCHTAEELRRAEALGVDFAVLGPVAATPTHPGAPTLGWEGFGEIARDAALPIFALGGVRPGDLERAWSRGAHGIAMIRGAWGGGREKGDG
ncbi:MAG TPA: Nudix family hydrolase [Burkholderiales bacterium]|nr:Nudix family hydrolase [Burkholderiales bacterium]